eukprot:scaffold4022_cov122-Isochrysis_galbana.AAC.2
MATTMSGFAALRQELPSWLARHGEKLLGNGSASNRSCACTRSGRCARTPPLTKDFRRIPGDGGA